MQRQPVPAAQRTRRVFTGICLTFYTLWRFFAACHVLFYTLARLQDRLTASMADKDGVARILRVHSARKRRPAGRSRRVNRPLNFTLDNAIQTRSYRSAAQ
jgi:hypothetical protein